MNSIFNGPFRVLYLTGKTVALHAGVFFLCYYWPQFVARMFGAPADSPQEALGGMLLVPLGLIVLGIVQGWVTGLLYSALVGGAILLLIVIGLDGGDPQQIDSEFVWLWSVAMIIVYFIAAPLGLQRQLKLFPAKQSD